MPVVEADVKTGKVLRPFGADARDQFLRRDAFGFRLEHDGRAVRVVRADEMHRIALHALEPYPDVGLDVLHDMADMKRAVGVRQGGGDEEFALHCCLDDGNEYTRRRKGGGGCNPHAFNCIAQPLEYPLK
jgi:hypothetical protein